LTYLSEGVVLRKKQQRGAQQEKRKKMGREIP
jgi:hypothetical protein